MTTTATINIFGTTYFCPQNLKTYISIKDSKSYLLKSPYIPIKARCTISFVFKTQWATEYSLDKRS